MAERWLTDDPAVELAHRNLMAVNARLGEAPGGAVRQREGTLLFASPSPLPFFNGVMREPRADGSGHGLLEDARAFFFEMRRGFVVFCWQGDPELEDAAAEAGMLEVLPRYPEMICRNRLPELSADLREVRSESDAAAYWEICDAAYPSLGFPSGLFTQTFTPEDLLEEEWVSAWLACEEDLPLACAAVFMSAGVGMVGWVAARPEARGRGLAAACTVRATNAAFDRGAKLASLQASTMGESLYRRLGYEELYSYRLLGAMPP
jgi:GNAT superfamily N-acetyltransferase